MIKRFAFTVAKTLSLFIIMAMGGWAIAYFPAGAEPVTPQSDAYGYVAVYISPTTAVDQGAKWSFDGDVTWIASGSTISLSPKDYTISFKGISGWISPPDQSITVVQNSTQSLSALYATQASEDDGALTVSIKPSEAVALGAKWSVDSGENWQDSGSTVSMSAGTATLSFKTISGWDEPANQSVTVNAGLTSSVTQTYAQTNSGTWTGKRKMPTARTGAAAATYNGKIYVIGGYNGAAYVGAVEEFDPSGNTWTTKTSMPTGRGWLSATIVNNKIYAIGGQLIDELWGGGQTSYSPKVEEYDPSTNTWTSKRAMQNTRSGFGIAVANGGKIYAIGGYNETGFLTSVEEYTPSTNIWVKKKSMPTARAWLTAAGAYKKIYAIGGYTGSSHVDTVEEYDPSTNAWSTKTSMSTTRSGLGSAIFNGRIFTIGGTKESEWGYEYLSTAETYAPKSDEWSTSVYMGTKRSYPAVSVADGKLYVFGGSNENGPVPRVEEFSLSTSDMGVVSNSFEYGE